jgi:hypothetical protein
MMSTCGPRCFSPSRSSPDAAVAQRAGRRTSGRSATTGSRRRPTPTRTSARSPRTSLIEAAPGRDWLITFIDRRTTEGPAPAPDGEIVVDFHDVPELPCRRAPSDGSDPEIVQTYADADRCPRGCPPLAELHTVDAAIVVADVRRDAE